MDGFDLGLGILFPLFPAKARSRRHHEQRRAGLGRQRNLAGARRRRHDGGVSAGLCGADAGALHADDRDAARPGLPRRRLRIPLARRRASATAGTSPSPADRCWRRWRRALRSARILQGIHVEGRHYAGGWWDWLTPFSILTGVGAGDRLCAARRDLAGHEDRGRAARPGLSSELVAVVCDAGRDRRGQHRDAVPARRNTPSAGSPGRTSS